MSIPPPKEALYNWHTVKPSSFAVFLLMCEAKDSRSEDVYLDLSKAEKAGIKKSAYYQAFSELESKQWVEFSRTADGKKWWKLTKGNSANVESELPIETDDSTNVETEAEIDSANVENSMNVENKPVEIPQTWNGNSANVESPLQPPIRNNITQEEIKPKKTIAETSSAVVEKDSPELIAFRKTLSAFQNEYAEPTTKGLKIANNNSIRALFKLARGDTSICLEIHRFQQAQDWRNGKVDWTTVQSYFNFYLANQRKEATNGSNQIKHSANKRTNVEKINGYADIISKYPSENVG